MKNIIMVMGLPQSGTARFIKDNYHCDEYKIYHYNDLVGKVKDGTYIRDIVKKDDNVIMEVSHMSIQSRKHVYRICKSIDNEAKVKVIVIPTSIDSIIARSKEKISKESLIDVARKLHIPQIQKDCDEIQVYNNDINMFNLDIDMYNDRLRGISHDSTYHLDSIGTHISMILQDLERDKEKDDIATMYNDLVEVAKYHDISKNIARVQRFGFNSFIGHENISALMYLANTIPVDKLYTIATSNKNGVVKYKPYIIAEAISQHMSAQHSKKKTELAKVFSVYDEKSSISSPLLIKNGTNNSRVYNVDYNNQAYCADLIHRVKYYNLTGYEVSIVIEGLMLALTMHTSEIDESNKFIIPGIQFRCNDVIIASDIKDESVVEFIDNIISYLSNYQLMVDYK